MKLPQKLLKWLGIASTERIDYVLSNIDKRFLPLEDATSMTADRLNKIEELKPELYGFATVNELISALRIHASDALKKAAEASAKAGEAMSVATSKNIEALNLAKREKEMIVSTYSGAIGNLAQRVVTLENQLAKPKPRRPASKKTKKKSKRR